MISNSIGPSYALFMLQALDQLNLTENQFFADTQLSRQTLYGGKNIDVDDFVQLLINSQAATNGDKLGLLIGKRSNVLVQGSVGHAAAAAPTLRAGLQIMESFSRLHASYVRVELQSHLKGMSISVKYLHPLRDTERFHIEATLCQFQSYVEMITGSPLTDALYLLPFSRPNYADEYAHIFHSPVEFDTAQAVVEIPAKLLDVQSPFYDFTVWRESQHQLSKGIKNLSERKANPYSQHLWAFLNSHEPPLPKLGDASKVLHISERTLNRRLLAEGTSFREIKSQITHQWAQQYLLRSQLSIEAIAAILGYQDTANFRRAFRKQQDCSPQVFRTNAVTEKSFSPDS